MKEKLIIILIKNMEKIKNKRNYFHKKEKKIKSKMNNENMTFNKNTCDKLSSKKVKLLIN